VIFSVLFQETKLKIEDSEKAMEDTKKEILSMWQQLRHMYFSLQVPKTVFSVNYIRQKWHKSK